MASAKYGITSAMSDVVSGYEKSEDRRRGIEKGEREAEAEKMKLQQMRGQLEKEGVADSIRLMLAGDTEGAMAKYNSTGEDRMSELEFDPETGLVSFLDKDGIQRDMMIGQLMVSAGMDPRTLDTPDAKLGREKELITHRAKEGAKYGLPKGSKSTAYIQNLEYTMKNLTGGDARKAFELMQLSKSDPQAAYARILLQLQKDNKEKFEDKMSEEEMRQAANEAVTDFRKGMLDKLIPGTGGSPSEPAQQPGGITENPSVFNESDPMGLRKRGL